MCACRSAGSATGTRTVRTGRMRPSLPAAVSPQGWRGAGRGLEGTRAWGGQSCQGALPAPWGPPGLGDGLPCPGCLPARLAGGSCGAVVTADLGTSPTLLLTTPERGGRPGGRLGCGPCAGWALPQPVSPAPLDEGLGGQESRGRGLTATPPRSVQQHVRRVEVHVQKPPVHPQALRLRPRR